MSTPVLNPTDVHKQQRWLQIDWAMKAVTIAIHLCERLHMADVTESLESVHSVLLSRRDRV